MHGAIPNLALRPERPEDEGFLFAVFASTREAEMALVDWTPDQKAAFLKMQFTAQRRHYGTVFASASFDIISLGGRPAGRLCVNRAIDEIHIVDIALLAEFRRLGIGTSLIRGLLAEAATAGKPLRIHVERFNPAQRLYARLGFRPIADQGVYLLMEAGATP